MHLLAVDRDDEGVRQVVALDAGVAFLDAAHEPAEQLVLAVGREHVPHHAAAARAERQPVDVPFWLKSRLIEYSAVPALHLGIADRQRADALRGGEVAVEQQRRRAQRRGDVVEAEVAAVVRQQRGHVDVERQQIADRVAVLGAVQAVDDVAAGRAAPGPGAIERFGQPAS